VCVAGVVQLGHRGQLSVDLAKFQCLQLQLRRRIADGDVDDDGNPAGHGKLDIACPRHDAIGLVRFHQQGKAAFAQCPRPVGRLLDHLGQHIALAEDLHFASVHFDVAPGILAVDYFVADDYRTYAARLSMLMDDAGVARRLADNAHKQIVTKFRMDSYRQAVMDEYENLT